MAYFGAPTIPSVEDLIQQSLNIAEMNDEQLENLRASILQIPPGERGPELSELLQLYQGIRRGDAKAKAKAQMLARQAAGGQGLPGPAAVGGGTSRALMIGGGVTAAAFLLIVLLRKKKR